MGAAAAVGSRAGFRARVEPEPPRELSPPRPPARREPGPEPPRQPEAEDDEEGRRGVGGRRPPRPAAPAGPPGLSQPEPLAGALRGAPGQRRPGAAAAGAGEELLAAEAHRGPGGGARLPALPAGQVHLVCARGCRGPLPGEAGAAAGRRGGLRPRVRRLLAQRGVGGRRRRREEEAEAEGECWPPALWEAQGPREAAGEGRRRGPLPLQEDPGHLPEAQEHVARLRAPPRGPQHRGADHAHRRAAARGAREAGGGGRVRPVQGAPAGVLPPLLPGAGRRDPAEGAGAQEEQAAAAHHLPLQAVTPGHRRAPALKRCETWHSRPGASWGAAVAAEAGWGRPGGAGSSARSGLRLPPEDRGARGCGCLPRAWARSGLHQLLEDQGAHGAAPASGDPGAPGGSSFPKTRARTGLRLPPEDPGAHGAAAAPRGPGRTGLHQLPEDQGALGAAAASRAPGRTGLRLPPEDLGALGAAPASGGPGRAQGCTSFRGPGGTRRQQLPEDPGAHGAAAASGGPGSARGCGCLPRTRARTGLQQLPEGLGARGCGFLPRTRARTGLQQLPEDLGARGCGFHPRAWAQGAAAASRGPGRARGCRSFPSAPGADSKVWAWTPPGYLPAGAVGRAAPADRRRSGRRGGQYSRPSTRGQQRRLVPPPEVVFPPSPALPRLPGHPRGDRPAQRSAGEGKAARMGPVASGNAPVPHVARNTP